MKKAKFFNNSTRRQWFLSYVLVLCIPILLCFAILLNMQVSINREKESEMDLQIKILMQSVEMEMEQAAQPVTYFYTSDVLERVVMEETRASDLSLTNLQNAMQEYVKNLGFRDLIYVYLPKKDLIVCKDGMFVPSDFWKKYFSDSGISYSDWKEMSIMRNDIGYALHISDNGDADGNKDPSMAFHTFNIKFNASDAFGFDDNNPHYAVVNIMMENAKVYAQTGNIKLVVLDEEDQIVYGIKYQRELRDVVQTDGAEKSNVQKQYIIKKEISKKLGYTFIVAAERYNIFTDSIEPLIYFCIIFLLGFGCVWLIWRISSRNYAVVGGILNQLKRYRSESDSKDEISIINKLISKILKDNVRKDQQLEMQQNQFVMLSVNKLIRGNVTKFKEMQKKLPQEDQIQFLSDSFAVAVVYIDDFSKFADQSDIYNAAENEELITFAIRNVAEEIVAEKGNKAFFADVDHVAVFIVSFADNDKETDIYELTESCKAMKTLFLQQLKLEISISVSDIHMGLDGIRLAYEEAVEAMEYKFISNETGVITYDSIEFDKDEKYPFTQNRENQLIGYLNNGNGKEAVILLHKLLMVENTHGVMNIRLCKCMIFDIAAALIKCGDSLNVSVNISEDTELVDALIAQKDIDSMKAVLIAAVEYMAGQIMESNISISAKKIMGYIEANYADSDLSVAGIAEHFKMHPTYVSNMFKEQSGQGVLEFINKTRINHSLDLLERTADNISRIAEKVGYLNANTYIRIFKKFMGVTPNHYRVMHQNDESENN